MIFTIIIAIIAAYFIIAFIGEIANEGGCLIMTFVLLGIPALLLVSVLASIG